MNAIIDFVERTPYYVIGPTILIFVFAIAFMVWKSLREGREVSFWPPKIGSRPSDSGSASEKRSQERTKPKEGLIPRVKLPADQIGYLSLIAGGEIGSAWPITAGLREVRVGNGPGSHVCVPEDLNISAAHFVIYVKPIEGLQHRRYQFFVHDTGSANGTFVNGKNLGYEPYEVADKDTIEAGGCKFMLHVTAGYSETVDMAGGHGRTVVRTVAE